MKNLTTLVENTGCVCHSSQSNDAYMHRIGEMEKSDAYYYCADSGD